MFLFKQTQRINLQKKHECRQETLLGAERYAVVVAHQLKLLNKFSLPNNSRISPSLQTSPPKLTSSQYYTYLISLPLIKFPPNLP